MLIKRNMKVSVDLQLWHWSLKVDTSLEILEVRPEDAGTYFCNVETYGEPLDQAHTLDVLVPPSVQVRLLLFSYLSSWLLFGQAQPSNGKFVVRAGSTITLECRAQGNPMPRVAWTRQVMVMIIIIPKLSMIWFLWLWQWLGWLWLWLWSSRNYRTQWCHRGRRVEWAALSL